MFLKLFTSFAGIAGTVVGVAGASYSFLGSSSTKSSSGGQRAQVKDIESIDVSLRCSRDVNRGPSGEDDFMFAWQAKSGNDQLKKLKENQEVEIIGSFWFQANDWNSISKFAPTSSAGEVYMSAELGNGDKLSITFGRKTSASQLIDSDRFWCKSYGSEWKILSNGGNDGLVSFVKMYMPDLKTLKNEESKLKVLLNDCQDNGEGKTCKLQLISTHENKNIKVFEKEKFHLPK